MRILENGNYEIKFLNGTVREFESLVEADLKRANLQGVDLYRASFREASLEGANLKGANLRFADLGRAGLGRADLRGANLVEANLYGVDLEGSNLRGANLRGADLYKADLSYTNVITFNLGKDFAFYHEGYLKVGCHGEEISKWTDKFITELGEDNNYNEKQINLYKKMINLIKSEV